MSLELLSESDLRKIRERWEAATPGPWISFIEGRDHTGGDSVIQRGRDGAWEEDLYLSGATVADHDFIAHAHQDIARLLDEIERLRKDLNK
jgi:Ead/Ea22-like protein